jgi:hypothetical protein
MTDSVGCASSGSFRAFRMRSEPFAVMPSRRYYVGFMIRLDTGARDASCKLTWCKSMFCSFMDILEEPTITVPTTQGWQSINTELTSPAGAVAARFECGAVGTSAYDRFYVNTAAPKF